MMAKTLGYDELIMVASPKYRYQGVFNVTMIWGKR
ncbi:hypothetical protein N779_14625 [Vibrio coralliilyticus OCN008]|nr:hypothetical protein N779_14625 [Vibrio coralliilyticus OCN008]